MKKPKIRFKNYNENWELRRLGNLLVKNSKKNFDLAIDNVESVSNKTGFTKQTEQFEGYSVASADLSNYYVISEQQFAYNPSRINVGSIAYKERGKPTSVVSPLYVSFSTNNDLEDGYLWNWFKTEDFERQRKIFSEGGVRDTLSFNQLSEITIDLPGTKEQQEIGALFNSLDNLITLHQRKLDLSQELKKTLLSKMFPENDSKYPKIRFEGFTDAWEQRKLCDVISISSEKNGNQFSRADVLSVSREAGVVNQIEYQGRSFAGASIANYRVVRKGDLIYTKSPLKGAPNGIFKTSEAEGIVSPLYAVYQSLEANAAFVGWLLSNDNFATHYLYPLVNKGPKNTLLVSDADAISGHLSFPNIEEQAKIVSFFTQLDNLITLHQRKLFLLKELKKTLLKNMFV